MFKIVVCKGVKRGRYGSACPRGCFCNLFGGFQFFDKLLFCRKTAYNDFLKRYLKNNKKDCAEVVYFKAKINEKKELWSDFEMLLGEITDYYTLAGKEDFLKG